MRAYAISATRSQPWIFGAMAVAIAVSAIVLFALGLTERGVHAALAATARLAFLFFWPSYAAGALFAIFGGPFRILRQYARELGFGFIGAISVHLGLVALICAIGYAPPLLTFIFFGTAAALAYALGLFSIPRLRDALGERGWRVLNLLAMNYIAYAFLFDFLNRPLEGGVKHIIEYLPFAALALAGPALRIAAFARKAALGEERRPRAG